MVLLLTVPKARAENPYSHVKKCKRKVQGVPQSQNAALPEEETDKSKQAQIKQTYEKH